MSHRRGEGMCQLMKQDDGDLGKEIFETRQVEGKPFGYRNSKLLG